MNNKYSLPKDGGLIEDLTRATFSIATRKISTSIYESEYTAVQHVADTIVSAIAAHPARSRSCWASPPDVRPLGLYNELVRRHKAGRSASATWPYSVSTSSTRSARTSSRARNYRIHEESSTTSTSSPRTSIPPDGTIAENKVSEYCDAYDRAAGKIDLMIIGVGENGQIGFNEPGSYARSRTRLVKLSYNTSKVQSGSLLRRGKHPENMAITMGIGTIMRAKRIILMAWGEDKSHIVQKVVEGRGYEPGSGILPAGAHRHRGGRGQECRTGAHPRADTVARRPLQWTPKFVRKAVVWLCGVVKKPILKLTYNDYIENSLGELLEQGRTYDRINIDVFNDLQHTITGWPGGKPNADDSTRPVASTPFPKRVVIFSPHPDDDVISMGGTFIRLVQQGHDVHVAYETSGNVAVHDDVVLQNIDTSRELGYGDHYAEVEKIIAGKKKGQPEPRALLLDIKGSIRRAEARAAVRSFGLNPDTNAHFLNLPFYETGGIKRVSSPRRISTSSSSCSARCSRTRSMPPATWQTPTERTAPAWRPYWPLWRWSRTTRG